MSTKPCPRCGSAVPLSARFCGQCGGTFDVGEAPRRVPTTIDEATADPPPVDSPSAIDVPPAAMTMLGHVPLAARASRRADTSNVGRPALDAVPFGSGHQLSPSESSSSPTGAPLASESLSKGGLLAQTMADPEVAERARQIRDLALAEAAERALHEGGAEAPTGVAEIHAGAAGAQTTSPLASPVGTPTLGKPALGKTMMLGSTGDVSTTAALTVPAPAPGSAASPLSKSLLMPSSWPSAPSASETASLTTVPSLSSPQTPVLTAVPSRDDAGPPTGAPQSAEPPRVSPEVAGASGSPAESLSSSHTSRQLSPQEEAAAHTLRTAGSDKRTMLGMPRVDSPAFPPAQGPQPFPATSKTILGVAIPGVAPTHDNASARVAANPRAGTLIGVAAPGIAPSHGGPPSHQHVSPSPRGAPYPPPSPHAAAPATPPIVPPPGPLVVEPLPAAPVFPKKKGVPALLVVGIVSGLVLAGGLVATVLLLRTGSPLSAEPRLDETGKESLALHCASCPDGTVVTLGASSSTMTGGTTILPLPAPLSMGDNELEVSIDRPLAGRDETVKVHVPVAYRVKIDLSTLTMTPPAITVRVDALEGTTVTVDGHPVTLDGAGKGSFSIDVTSDVEGPSNVQRTIDRKIPFTVEPKGSESTETGELVVRTGVAPLHIDAPAAEFFTDQSTGNVAGQVRPGSTVSIDGQNVAVDGDGRFGVRVELPPHGEKRLTIVANSPPLAPRTVRTKIVRVASLHETSKQLDARSPLTFDAYSDDPNAKKGQLAVVDGVLQDVRVASGFTVMAVEEKRTCRAADDACVVRIVHGEEFRNASRGDPVHAYGWIRGTATSGGKTVPDVEGALVIVKPTAKR